MIETNLPLEESWKEDDIEKYAIGVLKKAISHLNSAEYWGSCQQVCAQFGSENCANLVEQIRTAERTIESMIQEVKNE